jgi:hypothetical protein
LIYDFPDEAQPIRQGDIFVGLPRVEISMRTLPIVDDNGTAEAAWKDVAERNEEVTAILPVRPVTAIVATQDCDTAHAQDITLCEIRPFGDVYRTAKNTNTPKGWVSILTQHARVNLKWFYLPPDERMGFAEKLAVDFAVTIRVPREHLEELRGLRRGRLNPLADEHFRERLAEFFRRYPYDEWYPFDPDELAEYRKKYPDAAPFPWQNAGAEGGTAS